MSKLALFSQDSLEFQRLQEPLHVKLEVGNVAPASQQADNFPKGRLHALLPACRCISLHISTC